MIKKFNSIEKGNKPFKKMTKFGGENEK